MRILLLSPPYLPEYMRNARCDFVSLSATQWYPILLGYCGAFLEGQGHDVRFVDAPAHGFDHDTTRRMVLAFRPDMLVLYTGFMSETNDLGFADSLVESLHCDAAVVGPYASIAPEETLSKSQTIDKLIVGEFEHPMGELASGARPSEISNLVYREGNRITHNARRPHLTTEALDAIPFISRFFQRHVNPYRYRTPSEHYPFMDIMTGRGCKWGHCTYCLWVHTYVRGATYNVRSVSNVIEELRFIRKDLPYIRSVMVQDDTFTEERAWEFCEAKLQAGILLPWSCYARANMSYDVLCLMKRSGCRNLHVGYESADPKVLKSVRKGITVEQMNSFTANARRAGLHIHGDFALGFPGETMAGARRTIQWALSLRPHTAQFQLMIPFPGTPYYSLMEENGWLNNAGQPDLPEFTNEQIRKMAKKAYRSFYFSPHYLWTCCQHPYEHIFGRLRTISRAIPAMFWTRWQV